MIQYNNQNSFKEIHYNGHDIQKVYCDTGDLVWQKQSPGPTPTFDGKFKLILNDESVISAECDSTSSVTSAETSQYSDSVVSAEIGDCVTSIGDRAFQNCSGLTSITMPNSVTEIANRVFQRCSGLASVTMPDSVTSIGEYAFYYCTSLTSVVIPDSVTSIGRNAFGNCHNLTSCTIGSGVTSIDKWAFVNCYGITSVTCLATTPPTLGEDAFDNTNNCPIYVPAQSVDAYKSVWDLYADRIQAIPNS